MNDLPDDIIAILKRHTDRVIDAYNAVSDPWKYGMESVTVTLTAMQCATILSLAREAVESGGGEIPGAPPLLPLTDPDLEHD